MEIWKESAQHLCELGARSLAQGGGDIYLTTTAKRSLCVHHIRRKTRKILEGDEGEKEKKTQEGEERRARDEENRKRRSPSYKCVCICCSLLLERCSSFSSFG